MISVAACEPELPPLEMIKRDEHREDDRAGDLVLEEAHGRGREHFADEENDEPGRALANHRRQRRAHVGLVEGLETAELLEIAGRLFLGDVEHIVEGHDSRQPAVVVDDRKCGAVVLAEDLDGCLSSSLTHRLMHLSVHHVGDVAFRGEQDLADPQVVDQLVPVVDDVDDVQCLAVATVLRTWSSTAGSSSLRTTT